MVVEACIFCGGPSEYTAVWKLPVLVKDGAENPLQRDPICFNGSCKNYARNISHLQYIIDRHGDKIHDFRAKKDRW